MLIIWLLQHLRGGKKRPRGDADVLLPDAADGSQEEQPVNLLSHQLSCSVSFRLLDDLAKNQTGPAGHLVTTTCQTEY